jgi:hypothetical protein
LKLTVGLPLQESETHQHPGVPRADPEPQVDRLGSTIGAPLILGTCGRDAASGFDGLTAPGIPGEFA